MSNDIDIEPDMPQGTEPPPEDIPTVSEEQARTELLDAAVKEN